MQNPKSPAYQWTSKLRKLLPWLKSDSTSLSISFRNSLIQQSLLVAYAKHEHVGGKSRSPQAEPGPPCQWRQRRRLLEQSKPMGQPPSLARSLP